VLDGESDALDKAHDAHSNEGPTQEGILSSDPGGGRQHHVLPSTEGADGEVVLNFERIGSRLDVRVQDTVQLLEIGQPCRSHPHDKVLVGLAHVQLDSRLTRGNGAKLLLDIRLPCDPVLTQSHVVVVRVEHRDGVVEETGGNQTAGEVGSLEGSVAVADVGVAVREGSDGADVVSSQLWIVWT